MLVGWPPLFQADFASRLLTSTYANETPTTGWPRGGLAGHGACSPTGSTRDVIPYCRATIIASAMAIHVSKTIVIQKMAGGRFTRTGRWIRLLTELCDSSDSDNAPGSKGHELVSPFRSSSLGVAEL